MQNNSQAQDQSFLLHETRRLHQLCLKLDHERKRLNDNNRSLQHELTNVHRELDEFKALSEIRGKELFGAQVFLTKADSLSSSDLIEKVSALNDEIFHAAAFLGESLVRDTRERPTGEDMVTYFEKAKSTIGEPMAVTLVKQSRLQEPSLHPLVVQVVLQIFLVRFCALKIASWFPNDVLIAEYLGTLYQKIAAVEARAVAGRWRALTRAQMRPTSEEWTAELIIGIHDVFKLASWQADREHIITFEQKLGTIFKAVEDLRIALGERFTSADLEVNTVDPTMTFDARWMEDGYSDARQSGGKSTEREIVYGTTGLGLKKTSRIKNYFEPVFAPKVLLESTIVEVLEPPPPREDLLPREDPPRGSNTRGKVDGTSSRGDGASRWDGAG